MNANEGAKRRSDCPISFCLDIFGDKWSLLILRDITFYHRARFREFAPQERIATNILANRLGKLEKAGLITKTRDPALKNQYIYGVSQKGRDLLPTLIEMTLWGLRYDPKTLASKKYLKRLKSDKQRLALDVAQSIDNATFTEYRKTEMGIKA